MCSVFIYQKLILWNILIICSLRILRIALKIMVGSTGSFGRRCDILFKYTVAIKSIQTISVSVGKSYFKNKMLLSRHTTFRIKLSRACRAEVLLGIVTLYKSLTIFENIWLHIVERKYMKEKISSAIFRLFLEWYEWVYWELHWVADHWHHITV